MMKKLISRSLTFTVVNLIFCFFVSQSYGTLYQSTSKHKVRKVTHDNLFKLAQYDDLIRYYSSFDFFPSKHKLQPDFIRALIIAESNVNPAAISKHGAIGLGQLLYSTAKETAKEIAKHKKEFKYVSEETLNYLNKEDLFGPAVNILLTCFLISKYNHKFDGRLDLVVSAWNAGVNTPALKGRKPAPYPETMNLIGQVDALLGDLKRNKYFK